MYLLSTNTMAYTVLETREFSISLKHGNSQTDEKTELAVAKATYGIPGPSFPSD